MYLMNVFHGSEGKLCWYLGVTMCMGAYEVYKMDVATFIVTKVYKCANADNLHVSF
jgi:hypothetical protein